MISCEVTTRYPHVLHPAKLFAVVIAYQHEGRHRFIRNSSSLASIEQPVVDKWERTLDEFWNPLTLKDWLTHPKLAQPGGYKVWHQSMSRILSYSTQGL
jgi:hypothetical protein